MIPVVMLVINIGVLFSVFMTLFCLTVTCPSFEHILVAYLMMLTALVIEIITTVTDPTSHIHIIYISGSIISITQIAHIALSLLVNIFATSIIALKAWCVHVHVVFDKYFVDCALIDDTTCAYIQEIPQVADGKRDWYPNP
jgi:hypothetical protein